MLVKMSDSSSAEQLEKKKRLDSNAKYKYTNSFDVRTLMSEGYEN